MALTACSQQGYSVTQDDKTALEETRSTVFAAYRRGDVDTMMAHFHPDVIQIPNYDTLLIGKAAVRANYSAAIARFDIVMTDTLEDMFVDGDMASTHGRYDIVLTPKDGGEPMARSGRYMVIMKRWEGSPTGWSTFRELVQPAPEG